MATHKVNPPPRCRLQYTASSKSLASSPSIVTSGKSRKSTRSVLSASSGSAPNVAACAKDSSDHLKGISCERIAKSISKPGAKASPNTSSIMPAAGIRTVGYCVILTLT